MRFYPLQWHKLHEKKLLFPSVDNVTRDTIGSVAKWHKTYFTVNNAMPEIVVLFVHMAEVVFGVPVWLALSQAANGIFPPYRLCQVGNSENMTFIRIDRRCRFVCRFFHLFVLFQTLSSSDWMKVLWARDVVRQQQYRPTCVIATVFFLLFECTKLFSFNFTLCANIKSIRRWQKKQQKSNARNDNFNLLLLFSLSFVLFRVFSLFCLFADGENETTNVCSSSDFVLVRYLTCTISCSANK